MRISLSLSTITIRNQINNNIDFEEKGKFLLLKDRAQQAYHKDWKVFCWEKNTLNTQYTVYFIKYFKNSFVCIFKCFCPNRRLSTI